jgi:hypothetical protein
MTLSRIKKGLVKDILFVLAFTSIAFGLRIYTFEKKSLWIDEIYTFNDSRDGLRGQIRFYTENPTYLHPPLFYLLTHLFYPFSKPERDLRLIPLFFGILSVPMLYLLSRQLSAAIAPYCTACLTFMVYHISLSQDGRAYAMVMFLAMATLYSFLKFLETRKKAYMLGVPVGYALLFYTSYSSFPFIVFSQLLWFYRPQGRGKEFPWVSFLTVHGIFFSLIAPWVSFLVGHYRGQPLMDPQHVEGVGSLWNLFSSVLNDWAPHPPLMLISAILLILMPFFMKERRNVVLLESLFTLPLLSIWILGKAFSLNHFLSSRYFVAFLPLFLISVYLSLEAMVLRFPGIRRLARPMIILTLLFVGVNIVMLPLYFSAEKQDLRGLVAYLKGSLRPKDQIFDADRIYTPGILHYFGVYPSGRHYVVNFKKKEGRIVEYWTSFRYKNLEFPIHHSRTCCQQYIDEGGRLWLVAGKSHAEVLRENPDFVFKGYFDGSFLNWNRFPTDASIYLFLYDPKSSHQPGIDMAIE